MKNDLAPAGWRVVGAKTRNPKPVISESQCVFAPLAGAAAVLTDSSSSFIDIAGITWLWLSRQRIVSVSFRRELPENAMVFLGPQGFAVDFRAFFSLE
ncbi:MAG: hypothetical protein ABSC25_00855 [Roseiarcus sp.]